MSQTAGRVAAVLVFAGTFAVGSFPAADAASTTQIQVKPWSQQQLPPVRGSAPVTVHASEFDSTDGRMRKFGHDLKSPAFLDVIRAIDSSSFDVGSDPQRISLSFG